jgi:hypothetical protein
MITFTRIKGWNIATQWDTPAPWRLRVQKQPKQLTFLELAKQVLTEAKRPLAPSEIWRFAVSKGYDSRLRTQGRTPAQTLYAAIFLDERDNGDTKFVKYNTRPARYYLKGLADSTKTSELEEKAASEPSVPEIAHYRETQLHAFLCYFVSQRLNARTRTIQHNVSIKKEYGEWVHPDMIAISYPSWENGVAQLSQKFGDIGAKLYSFEIKKSLSFSNLREAFFQAVSNSSWAHEGYLAAADVSTDQDFLDELRRLATSFGIGIIKLDVEEPDGSDIFIPAKERPSVDRESLNKLARINADTARLLAQINNAIQIHDFKYGDFDSNARPEPLILRPKVVK